MNHYRRRLFLSFALSFISMTYLCLILSGIVPSTQAPFDLLCLIAFLMVFIPFAYPLWYFLSFGRFYAEDITNISNGIFKVRWDYSESEWQAIVLGIWRRYIEETRQNAIKDFKSFGYWSVSIPFLLLCIFTFVIGIFDPYAFWFLPVPLIFLYLANLRVAKYLLSIFQYAQIRKWLNEKKGKFILGEWGMNLGELYIPLFGSDFAATRAEIIRDQTDALALCIEVLHRKRLRLYTITNQQIYYIPISKQQEEKARQAVFHISGKLQSERHEQSLKA